MLMALIYDILVENLVFLSFFFNNIGLCLYLPLLLSASKGEKNCLTIVFFYSVKIVLTNLTNIRNSLLTLYGN